ncbi:hypothetical protein, partial [Facilibium subflavum]|uniref:hypothetical protein n=1 Tax=Facilibium subflavum TaxID=2219058 RepID=UPI0013C350FE
PIGIEAWGVKAAGYTIENVANVMLVNFTLLLGSMYLEDVFPEYSSATLIVTTFLFILIGSFRYKTTYMIAEKKYYEEVQEMALRSRASSNNNSSNIVSPKVIGTQESGSSPYSFRKITNDQVAFRSKTSSNGSNTYHIVDPEVNNQEEVFSHPTKKLLTKGSYDLYLSNSEDEPIRLFTKKKRSSSGINSEEDPKWHRFIDSNGKVTLCNISHEKMYPSSGVGYNLEEPSLGLKNNTLNTPPFSPMIGTDIQNKPILHQFQSSLSNIYNSMVNNK